MGTTRVLQTALWAGDGGKSSQKRLPPERTPLARLWCEDKATGSVRKTGALGSGSAPCQLASSLSPPYSSSLCGHSLVLRSSSVAEEHTHPEELF